MPTSRGAIDPAPDTSTCPGGRKVTDEYEWVSHLYLSLSAQGYGDSDLGDYGHGDGQESSLLPHGLDMLNGTCGVPMIENPCLGDFETLLLVSELWNL